MTFSVGSAIKAFDYPFRYKVSRLLPAKLHTPRVLTLSSYTMKRNDDSKYIRIKPLNVTQII
jgi:hypothetical protein